jgi:hypothetical protein
MSGEALLFVTNEEVTDEKPCGFTESAEEPAELDGDAFHLHSMPDGVK